MPSDAPLVGQVGLSMIAGYGLFASDPVVAGTPVLAFDHDVIAIGELGPINHSCDPTLGWSGHALVAIRDVAAGVELTTDYALFLDDPAEVVRCHCETYRCRQLVEGDDWQIPQLQKRYAGLFTPHLAQRIADS